MSDKPDEKPYVDPVVEYDMQFVDRAELRENLRLTPTERIKKFEHKMRL